MVYTLAVSFPLMGVLAIGLFYQLLSDRAAQLISCSFLVLSFLCALYIFKAIALDGQVYEVNLLEWFALGHFKAHWGLSYDTLTAVMVLVITSVSMLVHFYSIGYMHHDPGIARFMAYLSLFTFFMLMLVTAPNFLQLFFGWEGVGLSSYLLIGFWYEKESANVAAIKAFLVNRVGDIGFALGIIATFFIFGSVRFKDIFADVPLHALDTFQFLGYELHALTIAGFLLFIGAMGKSAQLGLHTWLPDAMEGPTPVSALIHAATMVTAGVFMVVRLSPMLEYAPTVLNFITVIGALTALFAGMVAVTQYDIKRVIAYSTCSQLGYMFFAAGVSAYAASIFHLMTHAFFKALLFLGAGSVIHAMSGEQDMRRMGGVYKLIPISYVMMWIGSLALMGFPFLAGYYSKDIILESAWASNTAVGYFAYIIGVSAALLTAFYSGRLLFLTFHGKMRADEKVIAHIHESPNVMIWPLILLSIGAIVSGFLGYDLFVGHDTHFWGKAVVTLPEHAALKEAHNVPVLIRVLPLIASILGLALSYIFYIRSPSLPKKVSDIFYGLYRLSYNKWYIDELYNFLFVRTGYALGNLFWQKGDVGFIDRWGPNGLAGLMQTSSRFLSYLQSGYIYHYAFAMLIGLVVFVLFYLFR